jgi:hypothetical protein
MLLNVVFAFSVNMVFNVGEGNLMDDDKKLIEDLGGPAKVCEILGYDKARGGVQRVNNWMTRGIPPGVKLAHPDLFLPGFKRTDDTHLVAH